MLKDIFRTVDGTMIVSLDKRGYLLVFNKYDKYLLTPITAGAVEKQALKYAELQKKARGKTAEAYSKQKRLAAKAA